MKRTLLTLFCTLLALAASADEGMWLPSLISQRIDDMRAKGFRLTAEDIYSINKASMKDAVVLFNGGCTGELISSEGLLLTNHHCGYDAIQAHSSVEHDYLTNGFWAMSRREELPNKELNVRFLVRMEEVTDRIAAGETKAEIIRRAEAEGKGYKASVEQMYYGNQQFLFIYEQFDDVRLVGAPPSSIGKFGGDTDNWIWPRHTGDFSLFRIYAGKDNKPAYNGIISTDNRAWRYMEAWRKDGTEEKAFQLSCQHVLASQPVALLAWMRDHSPEVLENTQWIFECKDYVRFRLTGEPRAELTDYSGANLVNLHTAQYDPALLALFGLSDCMEKLPPLCGAAEICGEITPEAAEKTGLLAGTKVAGGAFDIDACALAVDVVDEENICMIAGTWSINEYIRPRPVVDGKVMMNSFFCLPGYYLIEECSPTSAGNNEWFVQNLLPELKAELKKTGGNIYQQMDRWTDSIPVQEQCPIFFPFLMASNVHPNAMGSFVGMSNFHTRAHLVRSVYEGIAFSHRYHLEKLLATRDQAPRGIRLAGGVARSQV